ncbi:MAG: FAD-binding oxidoreductase [Pseudomonadota bacterium]
MAEVTKLPIDTGTTGWNSILPEAGPPLMLEADVNADFTVIGAGFAGMSAAMNLLKLKPDARVVLLEANRVAEGPAGRNSGFMIDLPHDLTSTDYSTTQENDLQQITLNRHAIKFAKEIAEEFNISEEAFKISGKVNGARGEKAVKHNIEYAEHLKQLGEPFQMLDAGEMKALTGSNFYRSGLYTPGTAMLQPALYIRSIAEALGNRIGIFERSPVISIDKAQGKWIAKTPSGSVTAPTMILATNGHIESFGHFKRRLVHIMLYASMTRALTSQEDEATGVARWGITPSDPSGTTVRKISGTGGVRIITRNRVTYSPCLQVNDAVTEKMGRTHDQSFQKRYPHLGNVEQEYRWSGRLCLSRNGVSAFGEVEPGLFSACCQNGLGTARGTLSGMAATEQAVLGETDLVKTFLAQEKPKKLPPAPLDSIGATALMKWEEWKAREEL